MRVLSEETKNAVLEYNIEYQKQHGISPSFRNIMHALNRFACYGTTLRYTVRSGREVISHEYREYSPFAETVGW